MAGQTETHNSAPQEGVKGHRWFAALYDPLNRSMERRLLDSRWRELLGSLSGKVLEIGFGTGANLPYYGDSAEVVGVEPDPFMLRRAREKLARLGNPRIELRQAGAQELPFAEHTFDHVVSTLVLCTVADPRRALAEIRRVLKPDGRLHFIEHVRAEGHLGRVQDVIVPVWKYIGAGCHPNRRTGQVLEQAGFRIERLETVTAPLGIPILVGTARPT